MTEQEMNIKGDCLNTSECGIYENGAFNRAFGPLMINPTQKAMKLT